MKKYLAVFCLGAALFALIGQGLVIVASAPLQVTLSRIERDGTKTAVKLPEPKMVFMGHNVRVEVGSVLRATDQGVELMGEGGWRSEPDGATLLRHVVWWVMFAACLSAGLYLMQAVRWDRREALAAKTAESPKIRLARASSSGRRGGDTNGV